MTGGAESADLAALVDAGELATKLAAVIRHVDDKWTGPALEAAKELLWTYCDSIVAHLSALEALAAENASLKRERAAILEEAALECERHAEFCRDEAHKGGNWEHLKARMDEAAYNAKMIRTLAALPASGQKEE